MIWRRRRTGGATLLGRGRPAQRVAERPFSWERALDEAVERSRVRRRVAVGNRAGPRAAERHPDAPIRILAFASATHPSSHYRALHPMAELMRRGHEVALHLAPGQLAVSDGEIAAIVEDFDVVFIARYLQRESWQLARRLRAAGVPVVWDYDDDVFMASEVSMLRSMLRSVSAVTTTSNALAKKYRQRGARRVVVIPNYLTAPSLQAERVRHHGIVLGYIGWIDHQQDWDRLGLREVVTSLLEEHRELRVESVGPIDLRLPPERYRRHGVLPFELLPQAIARLDIAIAPLIRAPGNATRSDIKLKEYAILGVPWLASPLGPYAGYGEAQGGLLVPNRGWQRALDGLIRNNELRLSLSRQGTIWANEHTMEGNAAAWEEILNPLHLFPVDRVY